MHPTAVVVTPATIAADCPNVVGDRNSRSTPDGRTSDTYARSALKLNRTRSHGGRIQPGWDPPEPCVGALPDRRSLH